MNVAEFAYLNPDISDLGAGDNHMTKSSFVIKCIVALIGCVAAAYVGQELLGGAALGWVVGGAVLGVTAGPFLQALVQWRKEKDAMRAKRL